MNASSLFVRVTIPLAVAISLSVTSKMYAVRIVGSVSGEVTGSGHSGDAVVPTSVDVGDPFSANFSYDSDALVSDCEEFCEGIAKYGDGLNLEMSFVIDSQSDGVYEWRGESPNHIVLVKDEFTFPPFSIIEDGVVWMLSSNSDASFTSFPNSPPDPYARWIELEFQGAESLTTSTSLPVSNTDLDLGAGEGTARITMNAGGGHAYGIAARLDHSTFSLAPVPEPTISADFDGDSDVDNDDLTHPTLGWETRFGVDLDGMNFLDWQGEFGTGVTPLLAAQATPEPSSLLLALAAIVMLTQTWRSRG